MFFLMPTLLIGVFTHKLIVFDRITAENFNNSDSPLLRASASGFIPSLVKPMTIRLVFTASLLCA